MPSHRDDEPEIEIVNEFAGVRVRKVYTRNGVRLEIESPKRGFRILLDAVELESLTWQTADTFSRFLRGSIGHDEDDGHPGETRGDRPALDSDDPS